MELILTTRIDTTPPATSAPRRTFHLTIAYDGTRYSGWQVQPGQRTSNRELERAAKKFLLRERKIKSTKFARAEGEKQNRRRVSHTRQRTNRREVVPMRGASARSRCLPDWSGRRGPQVMRAFNSRLGPTISS